jgi:soluble P-type ATPase
MLRASVPGVGELEVEHVVLDLNGTLTDRGRLIDGVSERLGSLAESVTLHLASADTFGSLDRIAADHAVEALRVSSGEEKRNLVQRLGPERCAVIGNGRNDALALEDAGLGIVVLGPEGAAAVALRAADVVCSSILDALDLLLEPAAITATLRA